MRNFSMKKFGTPIAGRARLADREGRVVDGRRAVRVAASGSGVVDLAGVVRFGLRPSSLPVERLGVRVERARVGLRAAACRSPGFLVVALVPARGRGRGRRACSSRRAWAWAARRVGVPWRASASGPPSPASPSRWASASGSRPGRGRRSTATGAGRPGISIDSTDAPGGTSTVSVSVWPLTSVTVTRCSSADAGTTRRPNMAAAASVMNSFRRLIWCCASPLSRSVGAAACAALLPRRVAARYWLDYRRLQFRNA